MKVQERVPAATDKPEDAIVVELREMFALYPSASLTISRHGVPEHCFARVELVRIAHAILKLDQQLEAAGAKEATP